MAANYPKVLASAYRGCVTDPFFRTEKEPPTVSQVSRRFSSVAVGEFFLWENFIWKKMDVQWGGWNAVSTERWAQFDEDMPVI